MGIDWYVLLYCMDDCELVEGVVEVVVVVDDVGYVYVVIVDYYC